MENLVFTPNTSFVGSGSSAGQIVFTINDRGSSGTS